MEGALTPHRLTPGTGEEKALQSGFTMPVYGIGTWRMGGRAKANSTLDDADIATMRAALEMGVRHIDTAEMYGEGHAEELVCEAIKGFERSRLFIASKALGHHLRRRDLIAACEGSLRRLGTDYLDLYMIHHPNDEIPIAETMEGMDELARRRLIRHVGVSNFRPERLAAAQAVSPRKIVANQVHYSVRVREPERTGLLRYCQKNDVMLVAWQPVELGMKGDLLNAVAATYDATPVETALNWLISQPNVCAIAGTRRVEHLRENVGALGWRMQPEDIELLREQYHDQADVSEVYPLK
jgi:diketogulonate reductase-like aldo/keto reductase